MTTIGSKYRGTKELLRVYARLIDAAEHRRLLYYDEVARILGISQPGYHMAREVGQVLGEISEDEHGAGRPMLSAVAVSSMSSYPGDGFFQLAKVLCGYSGITSKDKKLFWAAERDRVYQEWGS